MGEELGDEGSGMLQDVAECSRVDISRGRSNERWDVYTPRFLDIA